MPFFPLFLKEGCYLHLEFRFLNYLNPSGTLRNISMSYRALEKM